jgi:hypothetical protein
VLFVLFYYFIVLNFIYWSEYRVWYIKTINNSGSHFLTYLKKGLIFIRLFSFIIRSLYQKDLIVWIAQPWASHINSNAVFLLLFTRRFIARTSNKANASDDMVVLSIPHNLDHLDHLNNEHKHTLLRLLGNLPLLDNYPELLHVFVEFLFHLTYAERVYILLD